MVKYGKGGPVTPLQFEGFSTDPKAAIPSHLKRYVKDGKYTHVNAYVTSEGQLINPDEEYSGLDTKGVKQVSIPVEDYANYLKTGELKSPKAYQVSVIGLPTARRVTGTQASPAKEGFDMSRHIEGTTYGEQPVDINVQKGEIKVDANSGEIKEKFEGVNPRTGTEFKKHNPKGVKDPKANIVTATTSDVIIPAELKDAYERANPEQRKQIMDFVAKNGHLSSDGKAFAGLAIAALPALFKLGSAFAQKAKANRIKPKDPGYLQNQGVLENQRLLRDQYNNYELPGKNKILGELKSGAATSLDAAKQLGSSGDTLDAVTKLNNLYGKRVADLGVTEAQGKQAAFGQMLQGNAAAGAEAQAANRYAINKYQQDVAEKAALTEAGARNLYGAGDDLASLAIGGGFEKVGGNHFAGGFGFDKFGRTTTPTSMPSIGTTNLPTPTIQAPNLYQGPGIRRYLPTINSILKSTW